jgi:hypothetical protein
MVRPSGLNPKPFFKDGPGPVLEPVGGEFQTRFATAYPGGAAYLILELHSILVLNSHDAAKHYGA